MRSSYRPDYTSELIKRYFITTEPVNLYPERFITSPRHRYVHVLKITLIETLEDGSLYMPKNYILHADFVQDCDYVDHFVCFTNCISETRKYEQFNSPKYFTLWLTDHLGNRVNLSEKITVDGSDVERFKLYVELMLEY